MENTAKMLKTASHALGLGLDDENHPVCMVISTDSVIEGSSLALLATYYVLDGTNLRLSGPSGSLILLDVSKMCQDAAITHLPLVVIDALNQLEVQLDHVSDDLLDIYRGKGDE